MREALVKVKQPTPELDKKEVVYEVPCGECNHVYIGETGRTLRKCLTEHRAGVRKWDQRNGIAVHAWKSGHQVEWESAKVKEVAPNPLPTEGLWKPYISTGHRTQQTWTVA